MGLRRRQRARRCPGLRHLPDHPARGDDRPRGRVLRRHRHAGRRGDRLVRADRRPARLAYLGKDHDDAKARLGRHRCRRRAERGARPPARLRHRRQRGRARRAPLGRGRRSRDLLLHHGRHGHRRRRNGERPADARAAPSRVRAHADPARSRPRPVRRRLPLSRRLLRGARLRATPSVHAGAARPRNWPTSASGCSRPSSTWRSGS